MYSGRYCKMQNVIGPRSSLETLHKKQKFMLLAQYFLERFPRLRYAHKGLSYCQLLISFFKQLMEIVKERCSSN